MLTSGQKRLNVVKPGVKTPEGDTTTPSKSVAIDKTIIDKSQSAIVENNNL